MSKRAQKYSAYTDTWQTLMDVIIRSASLDKNRKLPLVLTSLAELPEDNSDGPAISFIHGPPGRNIALAIGLRAALPDTPMLLIMNADAVTLGMNHLIHAARRNMGMTLLILRSEVTDAVTASPVQRTNWHSFGIQDCIEKRATPLELATSLEAASVSRGSIDNVDQLSQLVNDAMNTPGFSMIGVTSDKGLPLGVLSRTNLPEYFDSYNEWAEALRVSIAEKAAEAIEVVTEEEPAKSSRNIPRHEVRIAGIGGQGVKLAGSVLNIAAGTHEGLWTTQRGEYGSATRGGPSLVEVVAGSKRISYPRTDTPDVLVLLNQNAANQFADSVKPSGQTIVDADHVKKVPQGAIAVPIVRISVENTGKPIASGVVSLGCIAAVSDVVSLESLKKSVAQKLPAKLVVKNIAALVAGYEATCKVLKGEYNG